MIVWNCDALLFDLDGVLVDSTACVEHHWRQWALRHGLDVPTVLRHAHGMRTVDTICLLAPHLPAEEEAAVFEAGEARDTHGVLAIAAAVPLAQSLPREAWAIVTSGTHAIATTRLRHTHIPFPAVLVTADDVSHGKPAPDAYQLAATRLGVPPTRCVVLEDAPAGIVAAQAAGMRVVAVTTTHPWAQLQAADAVVSSLHGVRVHATREESPGNRVHLTVRVAAT